MRRLLKLIWGGQKMLRVHNLCSYYGPLEALHNVDIEVGDKDIVCLIGSNGAGKTTLLKSISGMIRRNGEIQFQDQNIEHVAPRTIARMGIIHVPEGRHVFPGLTVAENLETGTINWHGFFGRGSYAEDIERVYELFPRLKERYKQYAWSLSGGEQQMLAIGRAMMGRPKLLMLDEPSMGLAPFVVEELFQKIVDINSRGLPILLVEQNARLALEVSKYAYVIEQGRINLHGSAKDLQNDQRVIDAYFGKFARKEQTENE